MTIEDPELLRMLAYAKQLEAEGRGDAIPVDAIRAKLMEDEKERRERLQKKVGDLTDADVQELLSLSFRDAIFDRHQLDIIGTIINGIKSDITELAVKGCTKAGKGAAVAVAANLWLDTLDRAKVIITSQAHKHARDVMFAEVVTWRKRRKGDPATDIQREAIYCGEQKYIAIANPDTGEGFSGHHGPATLFIFDEATSSSQEFFDLAKTQAALIVAIANPRVTSGWFRQLFPNHAPDKTQTIDIPGGKRRLITVSGEDCRNVIEGSEIIPHQLGRTRFEAIMAHPNPRWRLVYGLGQFPDEDPQKQLILPSWMDRHMAAWREGLPVQVFGLDVAASEAGDRTVLTAGGYAGVTKVHQWKEVDTMRSAGWVIRIALEHYGIKLKDGLVPVCVDMDGLGKGVGDRLAEQGVWVVEHRGNASAIDSKQYKNARTENYAMLAARLDPKGAWPDEAYGLPPHEIELLEDICAPEKLYESDGLRFGLTPKDRVGTSREAKKGNTIKDKLGRSPDVGDSFVYMYTALRVFGQSKTYAGDLVCSGEDPYEERRPFDDDELEELPDDLRELVEESRASRDEGRLFRHAEENPWDL